MDYTLLSSKHRREMLAQQIVSMEGQHFQAETNQAIALATGRAQEAAEFGLTAKQAEIALGVLRPQLDAEQPTAEEIEADALAMARQHPREAAAARRRR